MIPLAPEMLQCAVESASFKVFAREFTELYNPAILADKLAPILRDNPKLAEQLQNAIAKGDKAQLGIARGALMEKLFADMLRPYVDEIQTDVGAFDSCGKRRLTDFTGRAKCDLGFSGNPNDKVRAGERFSVEVKTGSEGYLREQFKPGGHIEHQASAHDGKPVVFVSREFKNLSPEVQSEIRDRFRQKDTVIVAGLPNTAVMDSACRKAISSV